MATPPHLLALCEALGISVAAVEQRGLPVCTEASDLEAAETGADGRIHLLLPAAATAWREMKAAACADGIPLHIVSAFRSVDRQAEIFRHKLARGFGIAEILRVSAPPGFSEHHTGRAVDIASADNPPLTTDFERTPAFAWLSAHASAFGFSLSYPADNPWGYAYEPWHWCFDDQPRAIAL